jgi:diguanylate cyclase (GGDEF)-like protein
MVLLFRQLVQCLITFIFLTLAATSAVAAMQPQEKGIAGFEDVIIKIEKLSDNDVVLAESELQEYAQRMDELSLEQQISYLHLLTDIYIIQGQFHRAQKTATDGLALTSQQSSPSLLIAELFYNRGFVYENTGKFLLATKDYESGLELAKSFNDNVLIAKGLINLGAIYYLTDRYENSLIVLNDAYNIAKTTDDEELKGSINSELGILYSNLNRNQQAMVYYQQSYEHYKNANKTMLSLNALVNIAVNHLSEEKYAQAINIYQTIINESKGFSFNQVMYNTYSGLSWANLKKKDSDPKASYQYLLQSKQYMEKIEQFDIELQYSIDEAFILFELERYDEAINSIATIESILAEQMPLNHFKMQIHINIIALKSKTYSQLGYYQKAYELQDQRLRLMRVLRNEKETQSVAEVRLALEAKEVDLQQKVLKNKQSLQKASLIEAEKKQQKQKLYLLYIAVVALLFAWLLVKLVQGQRRLYLASNTDMLTGIANRRELMKKGKKLFQQAKNNKTDFSVLIINIDYFKKINDQFGHSGGVIVLQQIVALGKTLMRKTDVFGRFGGEEFVILLPKTSTIQAKIIAERLRQSVEESSWEMNLPSQKLSKVSVSIGIANSMGFASEESADLSVLINKADNLLSQAKEQGRNRVCI